MEVLVVGGRLQGTEAAYLARKCGWKVLMIDKDPFAPASGLCDEFFQLDVVTQESAVTALAKEVALIIPALENDRVLSSLQQISEKVGIPLVFDPKAYAISSSKIKSNILFQKTGVPIPRLWPDCSFPVIVKPSCSSGSDRVSIVHSFKQLEAGLGGDTKSDEEWIIQELADGPSYSLEVLGCTGRYQVLQVTDLAMDSGYDCKRVTAPTILDKQLVKRFEEITTRIADEINLHGIMDVEVILNREDLLVLEIDARLPSQTPVTVYHSTGINMLELLLSIHAGQSMPAVVVPDRGRGVIYEQIIVSDDAVEVSGEHIMTKGGPLACHEDFFGADEAITNYRPGKKDWIAALVITGDDLEKAWEKRGKVMENILGSLGLTVLHDREPDQFGGLNSGR